MHHWRKGGVDLDGDFFAFEADGVGDFVAVNVDGDDGGVDKADFDVGVVGLKGYFAASQSAGFFLDAFDDERHFFFGDGVGGVGAAVFYGSGAAFDELAGDADYDGFGFFAGFVFG